MYSRSDSISRGMVHKFVAQPENSEFRAILKGKDKLGFGLFWKMLPSNLYYEDRSDCACGECRNSLDFIVGLKDLIQLLKIDNVVEVRPWKKIILEKKLGVDEKDNEQDIKEDGNLIEEIEDEHEGDEEKDTNRENNMLWVLARLEYHLRNEVSLHTRLQSHQTPFIYIEPELTS